MGIEYITKVHGEDYLTTHILSANGKSLSVDFKASYTYGVVSINDDMTIEANKAHLAEIVLAVELVKVIKENQKG